jgi:transitional endoplasmic reticulum ATPase
LAKRDRVELRVKKGEPVDAGTGIGRLDPKVMEEIGVEVGELIKVIGDRATPVKALPSRPGDDDESTLSIDGLTRSNAGVKLDQSVQIEKWLGRKARKVILKPLFQTTLDEEDRQYVLSALNNHPVTEGDAVRVELFGAEKQDFVVQKAEPEEGPAILTTDTNLQVEQSGNGEKKGGELTYENIGGLDEEIGRLREMIELPMKFPEVFQKLGIEPPQGVLLHGPPGTGKTLLARALADETDAAFFNISGPEIMGKYYGESEARLRSIFSDAEEDAPSIIFIDELDAIGSKREELSGEKQVEKRVVAQLLSLMDGLESRGEVIVIGATNISDSIDPALRRPGRFDREIEVGIPDREGRKEILQIHTRSMPMSDDVSLDELANVTHGFVGADLESLAKEAAMVSLRRIFPEIDFEKRDIPYSVLRDLEVKEADFREALKETTPSALREIFSEIPDVSWQDVGGLQDIKARLTEIIQWPFENKELFKKADTEPPKGILLYGEPGTGKTLLAKAVAHEIKANFISVNASNFISKWVGEAEKKITEVFKKARQAAPCVLFFDEIDSLTPTRGGGEGNKVLERVVSQLLVELDGTEELHGVVVIGATNRPDIIDPALLRSGRFEVQMELPEPDQGARKEIFRVHTRNKPVADDVGLSELAEETAGLVGADIESICQNASFNAIRRVINDGEELRLTKSDFLKAKKSALDSDVNSRNDI